MSTHTPLASPHVPDWVKFSLTIGGLVAAMALAWGDLRGDLRVEAAERLSNDTFVSKQLDEIKQLMREEYIRHHNPQFSLNPSPHPQK